jgi:gas vesicle protein
MTDFLVGVVLGIVGGMVVGLLLAFNPSSEVIKRYQECLSAGASVEYCQKN